MVKVKSLCQIFGRGFFYDVMRQQSEYFNPKLSLQQ